MATIKKIIGIDIRHLTLTEIRKLVSELKLSPLWTYFVIEYGVDDVLVYPENIDDAFAFLTEHGHWCFDYDPHFHIVIHFKDESTAVLFRFQCLLNNGF